ncbi:YHS domain-containing (seleno)protein [Alkalimarinus coralli]|uniref:YHS domain-containing (seleno)protein n=1 Tax=Alkalimarinus coralli TaxID=2935863 RepID=UPI00202B29FD|nr:YHS domain-containing (seleno)protein [Alkalimarinus coralli]
MIQQKSQHNVISALLLVCALTLTQSALAAPPIYTSFFSDVAVSGYDVVAYFTEHSPVKGNPELSTEYKGAEWHFSSQENLDAFKSNPEKYAPQYGGYCAWAVAYNKTAKGDPKQWAIHDGKLYLNYDANIKAKWTADRENLIKKADLYWPQLIQ